MSICVTEKQLLENLAGCMNFGSVLLKLVDVTRKHLCSDIAYITQAFSYLFLGKLVTRTYPQNLPREEYAQVSVGLQASRLANRSNRPRARCLQQCFHRSQNHDSKTQ